MAGATGAMEKNMNWTVYDFARLGALVAIILAAVTITERSRAAGKLPQGAYSFHAVWQVVGIGILVSGILAGIVFVWTGSSDHAFGLGGIMIGVVLLGSLRGFFSEYQLKRDGSKNRDKP